MTKMLKDRNEAFSQYFALGTGRSLKKLHENMCRDSPESVPGYTTLKDWSLKYSWQNQVMLMDKAVSDGLKDRLVPSWIELKAELVGIMVNQIRAGVEKGLEPENIRDMTALMKELRGTVGDDITKLDIKTPDEPPHRIEFVMYEADGTRCDRETGEPTEYQPNHEDPETTKIMLPDNHRD